MSTSSNTTFEFDVNHNGEFKLNPLTYQDGSVLNIRVFQMDFEDTVSYLTWKIPRRFTTLYYMLPPYYTLSGMKQIKNDYHTNVMYDIAKVAGKLQIFVSHSQIDLSTVLIPNNGSLEESFAAQYKLEIYIDHIGVNFVISKYIFPNASLAEMMNHVITDYSSENEDIIRKVTQNDYTFDQMVEWAEQEHFEDEETNVSCLKTDISSVLIPNNGSMEEPKIDLSYLHQMQKRKNILLIKTGHTISPISTILSSTLDFCMAHTHFFSLFTNYMAYFANEARQTIVSKLQREIQDEETLAQQLLSNLNRYSEEMRIRQVQITMLQSMPTTSLNTYGLHALLMTLEADICTTNNILRTRQQLLRSISAKQNFINSYMAL
ncbi:hypothetical protein Tco_1093186 [Tanacetum coccineum]|uniref:Uncharacterized protein n=1 Tax=Tanacetum coccineum TaxID=301880 RepID=A0ABQ5IBZ1_9ASTR